LPASWPMRSNGFTRTNRSVAFLFSAPRLIQFVWRTKKGKRRNPVLFFHFLRPLLANLTPQSDQRRSSGQIRSLKATCGVCGEEKWVWIRFRAAVFAHSDEVSRGKIKGRMEISWELAGMGFPERKSLESFEEHHGCLSQIPWI